MDRKPEQWKLKPWEVVLAAMVALAFAGVIFAIVSAALAYAYGS